MADMKPVTRSIVSVGVCMQIGVVLPQRPTSQPMMQKI